MRAKRSKRYRKTMAQYTLPPFSFREPYQVLLDAAFLRACHAFHMPLQKFLENTLHGKCRLFVTRCSLAKIMGEWEREVKKKGSPGGGAGGGRPELLPPPTEVPLRYCKHNDEETVVSEVDCLIDLLAGQPKGNEQPKNKQHFVLATADPTDAERRKAGRGFLDVREAARNVPGVPIVYVKRSVMVLEELSQASKKVKGGVERERLREGLIGGGPVGRNLKRKRGEEDGEEVVGEGGEGGDGEGLKRRGVVKRAKGPNPLSVKKKKVKPQPQLHQQDGVEDAGGLHAVSKELEEGTEVPKAKRRRKHKGKQGDELGGSEAGTLNGVAAASLALQAVVA
jgi:U3 small nucleolar RNA-associated protein 23